MLEVGVALFTNGLCLLTNNVEKDQNYYMQHLQGFVEIERHRFDNAAPFQIDGVYCKLIPLTGGVQ